MFFSVLDLRKTKFIVKMLGSSFGINQDFLNVKCSLPASITGYVVDAGSQFVAGVDWRGWGGNGNSH